MNINMIHIDAQRTAIKTLINPENQALIVEEIAEMISEFDLDGSIGSNYIVNAAVDEYGQINVEVILQEAGNQYYNLTRCKESIVTVKSIFCIISRTLLDMSIFINCYVACKLPADDYAVLEALGKIVPIVETKQTIRCEIPGVPPF